MSTSLLSQSLPQMFLGAPGRPPPAHLQAYCSSRLRVGSVQLFHTSLITAAPQPQRWGWSLGQEKNGEKTSKTCFDSSQKLNQCSPFPYPPPKKTHKKTKKWEEPSGCGRGSVVVLGVWVLQAWCSRPRKMLPRSKAFPPPHPHHPHLSKKNWRIAMFSAVKRWWSPPLFFTSLPVALNIERRGEEVGIGVLSPQSIAKQSFS